MMQQSSYNIAAAEKSGIADNRRITELVSELKKSRSYADELQSQLNDAREKYEGATREVGKLKDEMIKLRDEASKGKKALVRLSSVEGFQKASEVLAQSNAATRWLEYENANIKKENLFAFTKAEEYRVRESLRRSKGEVTLLKGAS